MQHGFSAVMQLEDEGDSRFVAPPGPDRGFRTYGGQFLAHTLGAAQATVGEDRFVHSTHSYFLSAGDAAAPTELQVDRLRDGRSFSQRQVIAHQAGRELFRTLVSFHVPEDGLVWEPPIQLPVPPPTAEVPYTDYCDFNESVLPVEEHPWPGRDRPMEVRYINAPTAPEGEPITEPQLMWLRLLGSMDPDRNLHDAGLAYLADATLVDHVLLPHGYRWQDPRLTGASLDHAMWFHRPTRADEWLFYDQRVESTAAGRGLASGRFYNLDGHLVATCMQEGLMRWGS